MVESFPFHVYRFSRNGCGDMEEGDDQMKENEKSRS
jgi:hypothetical protein